ncbi:hypothetical protein DFH29DRAFT_960977 [Suillus ampliporus]|nr:hypothetical protein DFH29DRAFT_960977 [Suillus ampliporus]
MPAWTIIPPTKEDFLQDHCHPILLKLFRVMKTIYKLLDPQNEPSSVHEGNHTATFGYTDSEAMSESSMLSSLFMHFRLSTQTSPRFALVSRDMQIEDMAQNLRIPVPLELVPVVTDICDFALARSQISGDKDKPEWDLACQVWKRVQIQKYHERLLRSGLIENIDSLDDPTCDLCQSELRQCRTCHIAMCPSYLCIDSLAGMDLRWCDGGPCWYKDICIECANASGTTCMCGDSWTCDLCTKKGSRAFFRCTRCNRPFCDECSYYIDSCGYCRVSNHCRDCAEEASENVVKETFVDLVYNNGINCRPCSKLVCTSRGGMSVRTRCIYT